MAEKYGYLMKRSKTWGKQWHDEFYVLCNIGLIYMSNPQDKHIKLFPFLEFEVIEVPYEIYNKERVIRLKTIKGAAEDMII
jgi:hypothetical protein